MKITIISTSPNEPSNSDLLADKFIEGMKEVSPETEYVKLRLKDLKIKHFTLDFYEESCTQEEDFCMAQEHIQSSQALVIATPVWNFGVPAMLKNFIDRMGSFALNETRSRGTLNGLPFYLIFTGGVPAPAWTGLMRKTTSFVPQALQYFGGSYIGKHFEEKCVPGRGKFGLVVNQRPKSMENVKNKGKEFMMTVQTILNTGKPPFKNRIQAKIMRIGEKILKKIF